MNSGDCSWYCTVNTEGQIDHYSGQISKEIEEIQILIYLCASASSYPYRELGYVASCLHLEDLPERSKNVSLQFDKFSQ